MSIPTAKRNHKGKLVSAPGELKQLIAKEYKDRLRTMPFRPDMKTMKMRKEKNCKLKEGFTFGTEKRTWHFQSIGCLMYSNESDL